MEHRALAREPNYPLDRLFIKPACRADVALSEAHGPVAVSHGLENNSTAVVLFGPLCSHELIETPPLNFQISARSKPVEKIRSSSAWPWEFSE